MGFIPSLLATKGVLVMILRTFPVDSVINDVIGKECVVYHGGIFEFSSVDE